MSYLSRYLAGDHAPVWAELVRAGAAVRREPLRSDAIGVARATMDRIAHNLRLLHGRLIDLGFEFRDPERALVFAGSEVGPQLDALEQEMGLLPISARAWYETFASVEFEQSDLQTAGEVGPAGLQGLGSHPALVVRSFEDGLREWHDYRRRIDESEHEQELLLLLDPCDRDKAPPMLFVGPVLSTCEPAHFEMGAHSMDDENFGSDGREDASFMAHVRTCIDHGGFPFWYFCRLHGFKVSWIPEPDLDRVIPILTSDLIAF